VTIEEDDDRGTSSLDQPLKIRVYFKVFIGFVTLQNKLLGHATINQECMECYFHDKTILVGGFTY